MNFRKDLFRNILISGGYNYSSQILTFLSSVVVSRFLGPSGYGFVGIIGIFTGFLSLFSDSGLSLVVIRTDYRYSFYQAASTLSLITGVILCLITVVLAYPISLYFRNPNLFFPTVVLSVNFILRSRGIVGGALLSKNREFALLGKITLITNTLAVMLTVTMAYLGANYWALIIPQLISTIFRNFLIGRKVLLKFRFLTGAYLLVVFRHVKKTVGNLLGFSLINYWARNSDNLFVAKFYSQADLGIYNRAYNFLTLPLTLITGLFGGILYPSFNIIKDKPEDLKKEYLYTLRVITWISFPLTFILVTMPDIIVMTLWGIRWIEVSQLLPYFGLLVLSQSLMSTVGNMLVLTNKEPTLRKSGWIGTSIMLTAIAFGACHSMLAIAQFYSLAFIAVILPFNIVYVFINALRFPALKMFYFWGPVIFSSFGTWLGCFYHLLWLKIACLLILLFVMAFSALPYLKNLKYFKRRPGN